MHLLNDSIHSVEAFAPASVANVAVGFDILGFAFDALGDMVKLTRRTDRHILIEKIHAKEQLPLDTDKNTASVALKAFCQHLNLKQGFSISIEKGIPLSSGMGGSAASAIATLVAGNQFLKKPLPLAELLPFALLGEKAACGEAHADNIVPCLFGGLNLIHCLQPLEFVALPIPKVYVVLLHPEMQISTREARAALSQTLWMKDYVAQSAKLAAFIAALYRRDINLLAQSMKDCIIEPQRALLIPDFYSIKALAMEKAALSVAFSGSGPTLFAFAKTKADGQRIASAMQAPLKKQEIDSQFWIEKIASHGAIVLSKE